MKIKDIRYDIIVIGAGHAGCEAAIAGAQLGSKVLLITMDMTKIAQMSCNPAMGGIAKGQMIREIDALGGKSALVTDASMIQFRMLNKSKGPAMWSPRAQNDRTLFGIEWRKCIEENSNIDIWQDSAVGLEIKGDSVRGVVTRIGIKFRSTCVILTSGTFGNGIMHIGHTKIKGGRISEPRSVGITEQLNELGFETGRMKTGTPARIDGRTINFEVLEEQKGDKEGGNFSFLTEEKIKTNYSCYITYTNEKVHNTLEKGFKDSPLFTGRIEGIGPRYCPSIEDKIITFSERESHQLFLEPEGINTVEYYINGFSSSLPLNIQYEALRKIKGLESARIFRPGYAIEYDYYPPTQLEPTLETKRIKNLYFAGQVNGTTGYEEAAGQGLIAGINAHLKIHEKSKEFILKRDESYIGVLIDDLVNKGVDEPYRMFTSRAEFRILLRQDNADERLTEKIFDLGLKDKKRKEKLKEKLRLKNKLKSILSEESADPKVVNSYLSSIQSSELKQKVKWESLILRPEIKLIDVITMIDKIADIANNRKESLSDILETIEIEIKYNGYIKREKIIADKIRRLEDIKINSNINIDELLSISTEGRQKLKKHKPRTIGQASRIPGISPSDINVLLIHMGR